jgi:hypothetical protein
VDGAPARLARLPPPADSGALCGIWLLALPVEALALDPAISFAPEAVEASGLTPGGKVVWFGVAREISERSATIVRREKIVSDDDKDGDVTLDLGRPVPWARSPSSPAKASLVCGKRRSRRRSPCGGCSGPAASASSRCRSHDPARVIPDCHS